MPEWRAKKTTKHFKQLVFKILPTLKSLFEACRAEAHKKMLEQVVTHSVTQNAMDPCKHPKVVFSERI